MGNRKQGGFKTRVGLQSNADPNSLFFIGLRGTSRWEYRSVNGSATAHTDYQVEETRWLGFFIDAGVLKFGWRAERKNYLDGTFLDYQGSMEAVSPAVTIPAYDEGNTASNTDRLDPSRPLLKVVELSMIVVPSVAYWYLPTFGDRVATFYVDGVRQNEADAGTFWGSQVRFSPHFNSFVEYFEDDNCVWEDGLVFTSLTDGADIGAEATQVEIYDALVYYK